MADFFQVLVLICSPLSEARRCNSPAASTWVTELFPCSALYYNDIFDDDFFVKENCPPFSKYKCALCFLLSPKYVVMLTRKRMRGQKEKEYGNICRGYIQNDIFKMLTIIVRKKKYHWDLGIKGRLIFMIYILSCCLSFLPLYKPLRKIIK